MNNFRVLIVDDELSTRKILKSMLKMMKIDAYEASDGIEALGKFENSNFTCDLIITDIHMPNMDGIELISKLRDQNLLMPILVISSELTGTHYPRLSKEVGGNYFHEKPLNLHKLMEVIKKFYWESVDTNFSDKILRISA